MSDSVMQLIMGKVKGLAEDYGINGLKNPTADTRLSGEASALDSIGLVNLIADIEEAVFVAFSKEIVLADDRAVTRRVPPFATVSTLADYVQELLEEADV